MAVKSDIVRQWHNLLFGVRRSVRYHHRRRRFFERWHIATNAVSVLFGSATIAALLRSTDSDLAIIGAAVVTVFSTIDLVVGTSRMAWQHGDLAKRFIELERQMLMARTQSDKTLKRFISERLRIEGDEPPPMRVLNQICHNELMKAMGYDKKEHLNIKWYKRLFAHLIDINPEAIST